MKIKNVFYLIMLIFGASALGVSIAAIGMYFYEDSFVDPKLGKEYLFSFEWDEENPFEEIKIDTVIVLRMNDDFVEWQYQDGIIQTTEKSSFRRYIKEFNKAKNKEK